MSTVPTALREPQPRRSFAWLLPVVALAITAFLLSRGFVGRGPVVRLQAVDGHGIRVGDSVRHLGIAVGEVEAVQLAPTLAHVELTLRLAPEAGELAREGSRFWIVRPELALDSVSGLETILGARYVAVAPGPVGGPRRGAFVALVEPPLDEPLEPGGLEILLEAPARYGLRPGAPVEYREVRVGTVLAVGLASDGSSVEARAYVRPQYAELVREGTRFWESGGFEVEAGFTTGIRIGLESLQAMLVGAVRFATPPDGGPAARTGHRFTLAAEPREEWLEWRPSVPVGEARLAPGTVLPTVVRARLAWREGRLLKRKKERQGWLVRTPDGVVGPLDLLALPEEALEGTARLEFEGRALQLAEEPVAEDLGGGLGRRALAAVGDAAAPPPLQSRRLTEAEDLLLVQDAGSEPLAVDRGRLAAVDGGFDLGSELTLRKDWHGSLAIARRDGVPVGVVLVDDDERGRLAPLP